MMNLLFDLPEEIQIKVMKMNPRPFDNEFKMKLHDGVNSWWYKVVSNSRNPHYTYQNIWKREGNPKYWFRCDEDHDWDEDWGEGFEGAEERKKQREDYERRRYGPR